MGYRFELAGKLTTMAQACHPGCWEDKAGVDHMLKSA